jgi:hypothetical protein
LTVLTNILRVQVLTGSIKAVLALSLASTLIIALVKEARKSGSDNAFVLNPDWHVAQIVLGSAMLAGVASAFAVWLHRLRIALGSGTQWSLRRRRVIPIVAMRGCAMLLIIFTYVTQVRAVSAASTLGIAPLHLSTVALVLCLAVRTANVEREAYCARARLEAMQGSSCRCWTD